MLDDNRSSIILATVRESFGRVVYSNKTHEKCADILQERQRRIRLAQIGLSALTTAGYVSAILGANNRLASVLGLSLSTILLAINSYLKDYDLGQIAQKHRQAGGDLWLIREHYQSLIADIMMGAAPIEELLERRDDLIERLHEVYKGAPSTMPKAYRAAQNALQNLEDMTFSDAEIDAFLPKELKKKQDK